MCPTNDGQNFPVPPQQGGDSPPPTRRQRRQEQGSEFYKKSDPSQVSPTRQEKPKKSSVPPSPPVTRQARREQHPTPPPPQPAPPVVSQQPPPQPESKPERESPLQKSVPSPTPVKVPFFGAGKFAKSLLIEHQALQQEFDRLESVLLRLGGYDALQIEKYTEQLRKEYSTLAQEFERYKRENYDALDQEVTATRLALKREVEATRAELVRESNSTRASLEQQQRQVDSEVQMKQKETAELEAKLINLRSLALTQKTGLYDFEHPAEESAALADELKGVRAAIKEMAKSGAYTASTGFTFNNSEKEGARFIKQMGTMLLSSYNAEAENGVKSVKAGNLVAAQTRLERALTRIEKNGVMISLEIKHTYHKLRLREMALAAEHLQAREALREQERENRAELREQAKVEAEIKKERERLAKERKHKENVRAKLIERVRTADVPDLIDLSKIEELEIDIEDILTSESAVEERAANRRAGYVYVVSNIGSFGEGIVKIGMTRRLEPMDRVKELGGASVPFGFDVHALFFSEDAYDIEAMLHREFAAHKVNLVNTRREHFYTTPADVLQKLQESNVAVVEYKVEAPAEDYRQSQLMRQSL